MDDCHLSYIIKFLKKNTLLESRRKPSICERSISVEIQQESRTLTSIVRMTFGDKIVTFIMSMAMAEYNKSCTTWKHDTF
jgi:hypothetical protein